jgi:8-oxo-dGTP diphosphatase
MDDAIRNRNADYRGCPDKIDWSTWDPNMNATLLFILRGKEVLLIHKKTGLGAGKVNAPGGKIEKGETAEQAAIREVREEIKIEVDSPTEMGILRFQFVDDECLALHCTVFCASKFQGNPSETAEAEPFWCSFDEMPYDQMWADDAFWIPGMLSGKKFDGEFVFDGELMLWSNLRWR